MQFEIFDKRLKESGLDITKFSEATGMNTGSVKNWRKSQYGKKTPSWVDSWMSLYEENRKLKSAVEVLRRENI